MTLATEKTKFTPEDLLAMPNGVDYELVDGNLVERKMGNESSLIAGIIITILNNFIRGKNLGLVFGAEAGYLCFASDPNKLRKPDVSFVRTGRLPGDRPPKGYARIAPDLAVEVISPGDLASEVDEKIEEYLGAGVRLIWVVNPEAKRVHVYRLAGSHPTDWLSESDTITGEDVLPGFECKVAEFFKL